MVWCHVAETSKGPHTKCNQDEEHPRSGLKCVHQKGRKDLNASQSIETKEDLLFGIPSRKQPLLFSAYEQCHDKIYYSSRCFHLCHLCSSDLSPVNSSCLSNSSILSISIISSSNVLSSLSRTRDIFFSDWERSIFLLQDQCTDKCFSVRLEFKREKMLLFHELVTTYLRILFYLPQGLAVCVLAFFSS